MNNQILCAMIFVVLFFVSSELTSAQSSRVYLIELNYLNGKLSLTDLTVIPFNYQSDTTTNGYSIELISFDQKILFSKFFQIQTSAHEEEFDPQTGTFVVRDIDLSNQTILLEIPYFANGNKFNLYNPNNAKILEFSVAHFADVCGDSICQEHESYESCIVDCSSGSRDDHCDAIPDDKCDPDCSSDQDADCEHSEYEKQNYGVFLTVFASVMIILIAGFAILKLKGKYDYDKLQKKYQKP